MQDKDVPTTEIAVGSYRAVLLDGSALELFQFPQGGLPLDGRGLVGSVLGNGPARDLVRSFLGGQVHRWASWDELCAGASGEVPEELIVSAEAWRRHGARIWSELPARHIYIARNPEPQSGLVSVAVQRPADVPVLLEEAVRHCRNGKPTIVHASLPSAVASAAAMSGLAGVYYPLDGGFTGWAEDAFEAYGPTPTWITEGAASWVVRKAVRRLHPDLLVMGWHRHLLPWPRLTHSTAWRLSRSVPVDVLLVRLGAR